MLILCLKQHKKTAFITWLLGGIVYIAEIGYLILKGRLILRVLTALDIVFILFTISFFIIYWKEFGKMFKGAVVVGIGLGLGVSILNIPMIKVSAEELQYGNGVLRAITQYCSQREENFYFSFGEMCITTRDTRLLTDEGCWNYTGFGGWTANSPLEKKRLERAGIENVEWSILNDDHVYIIGPDAEMTEKERVLREYLNNKYSNVIWGKTDVIDLYYEDYIVWKVSIEQ